MGWLTKLSATAQTVELAELDFLRLINFCRTALHSVTKLCLSQRAFALILPL